MKHIVDEKGQVFLEFALTLPILIIFLCFIVDMTRVVSTKIKIQQLAGEILKVSTLYDEGRASNQGFKTISGGVRDFPSQFSDKREAIDFLITKEKSLSLKQLDLSIDKSPINTSTYFDKKISKDLSRYIGKKNELRTYELTVNIDYDVELLMSLSKLILNKDSIPISSSYTGTVFVDNQ